MPRKTKDQKELEIEKEKTVKKPAKKASAKSTKKSETSSKPKTKKTQVKKAEKSSTKTVKADSKKSSTKKETTKAPTKKRTTTKASTKKAPAKKRTTKKAEKKVEILEYYDLPYRYNQTVIKVLAQTPNNLFIYWDISDSDRENLKKQYGENFFETTKPVLIVHNNTLNYSFEVEINDFANSWYLHVNDAKCNYKIELGRKPYVKNEKINTDYIYISTSNGIEAPNDRILFDKKQKMVYFRNVKTGKTTEKSINTISFIRNMGKIYDIYDLYKELYKDEEIDDIVNPSSNSFSSKFM